MEAGCGAAAAVGISALTLPGASASSHDVLDRGLRSGRHFEDEDLDVVSELAYIHPRDRPDWEETISAMARSAEIPELRTEPLMRSCSSSTASMKVKNVKKLSFTKGHFPKLAECAHFHYENVDFGTIQLSLADEQCEVTRNGYESKELVYLVQIYCQGRSWIVRRSYEDFRVLDKHLHLCIYDRRFSQLPELPRYDSLTDQSESVSQMLLAYLSRLSAIADNQINCGPALTWMEVDNKGNHLLVHEESSINVPAIAAAHVIKRYIAQAADELSFEVGDIVSVIDMPPKEDTTWWRGKHGFQVGFFPSECVELINDKVPQSVTNAVPKPASPCTGLQPASWNLFPPYLEMDSVKQDSVWVADPLNHYSPDSVSKKHGKLITFLRTFMKSRPTKQKLKQRGILRERVFGCDLGEHLLNSGHDVPQVLKSCTEFIEKHGVVDGIYRLSGIASNIQKLRHEFDSEQIPDLTKDVYIQDIHCVGSLCKLYFRELPNPLLTYQLYEKFSDAVSAATDEERLIKIHDVIQQLPPPHYRTLEFLMRHLSHLATFSYITNMHSKNLAIVWAPNLLRSKQIESACFSGTAAFMEVRIQSVVVEFILNHTDVLFSAKLSSLIREGAGHNSLSRPKSLLVSSPSTKLLSLEEAQARTQAQINSPVTEDSKYIEVGEGPAALQGKFHTVIEFPTERKRPPIKSKKSPVGSWRSFFNLGKSSSMSKRKLQRNPSEPNELKAMALAGGRGDTGTLRSAKSEESLTSLHNVEGESKAYRPRRPRSSSDALSTSFANELLDGHHHHRRGRQCDSYDNLDAAATGGDSDADDGPICVPALISPPRCSATSGANAGEEVDLSPPDMGVASLDFDPMSFQCSLPDTPYSFPLEETPGATGGEGLGFRTLGSGSASSIADESLSPFPLGPLNFLVLPGDPGRAAGEKVGGKKLTTSYSYTDKPTQAVSPIKCGKSASADWLSASELFPTELSQGGAAPPSAETSLSQAFQLELQCKLTTAKHDATDGRGSKVKESAEPMQDTATQEPRGAIALDTSKDPSPAPPPLAPAAQHSAPPPPPPKTSARMPAPVRAESAQRSACVQVRNDPPEHPAVPEAAPCPVAPQPKPRSVREGPGGDGSFKKPKWLAVSSGGDPWPREPLCTRPEPPHGRRPTSDPSPGATLETNSDQHIPTTPTPLNQGPLLLASSTSQDSPGQRSPERQQKQPADTSQAPVSTSTSATISAHSNMGSSKGTAATPQPAPEVKSRESIPPPTLPKPTERHSLTAHQPKPVAVSLSQHQHQTQPQPQAQPEPSAQPTPPAQPDTQPPPQCQAHSQPPRPHAAQLAQPQSQAKASARVAPTSVETAEKPWEAIEPVQPREPPKTPQPLSREACGPPAPPVRTMESKLAAAALSHTEGPVSGAHPDDTPHPAPQSPRKSASHQPAYLYHTKGEAVSLEPPGPAYYHHQHAGIPIGPHAAAQHHYRPEGAPPPPPAPHHSYISKSEPQIAYRAHMDGRYSTLGPRSHHHSVKSRSNHTRSMYISPGHLVPGQGYIPADRIPGYPTIRRVHSMHVPSAIRSVPVQRTEVPPDDELFFYHRAGFPCKAFQQQQAAQQAAAQQQAAQQAAAAQQQASQADYHVTQLQPYFENGRVQYRYSPYSGSSPLEAPFYDVDPYGTIRLRHVHSYGSRELGGTLGRHSGSKASGYHYLSRHGIPPGKEHSFVSRDMPPGHGPKGGPVYLSWDPEECERLRMHSIRRESRARQKMKGPVLSQYDNVGMFPAPDPSGYETLHLRSKSDPGKAAQLAAAEAKEGRHQPRSVAPEADVLTYMEPGRPDGLAKQGGSWRCQSSNSLSAASSHSLSVPHDGMYEAGADGLCGDAGRSKHWQQEHPNKRNFAPRYERPDPDRHQVKVKVSGGGYHSTDEQAWREQPARPKPERSHSMREPPPPLHRAPANPEADPDYSYHKRGGKAAPSHYDNLDDYHQVPQPQAPGQKRGLGHGTFPTPAFTAVHSSRAYTTALGQGAFLQTDLAVARPETEICTE
ncbi:unnamed protein product [Merluccius merluccius]